MRQLAKDVVLLIIGAALAEVVYLTLGLVAAVVAVLGAALVGAAFICLLDRWEARR